MKSGKPARVLIVDDSASIRETLAAIINEHPDMTVMATAGDPYKASEILRHDMPDVITLDVEMPRMDGITFLRRLMAQHPIPVVVCSSLVGDGTATLASVMDAGAVDVIAKPTLSVRNGLMDNRIQIQNAILGAARARVGRSKPIAMRPNENMDAVIAQRAPKAMIKTTEKIIAIGASTGGTIALEQILRAMPPFAPPIVIVQHMPEGFTAAFASRLDSVCQISVYEAKDGDTMLRGRAFLAPGGKHIALRRSGASYKLDVRDGPLVNRHRPSVDVLFRSVAQYAGSNAIGVILTGMGNDGARGLLEMRQAGAVTFGQNEASCIVYGMPAEAKKLGAVQHEVDLGDIARQVLKHVD
jgi:two-component system, chemotaxis family, protein-glutamate methylesterase/glutaminase